MFRNINLILLGNVLVMILQKYLFPIVNFYQ